LNSTSVSLASRYKTEIFPHLKNKCHLFRILIEFDSSSDTSSTAFDEKNDMVTSIITASDIITLIKAVKEENIFATSLEDVLKTNRSKFKMKYQ